MGKLRAVINSITSAGDGIIFLSEFLVIPILCLGLLLEFLPTSPTVTPANSDDAAIPVPELKSRTNFSASYGDTVLFSDSKDAWEAHPLAAKPEDTVTFVHHPSPQNYGRIKLGWLWQGQAGMNDRGLVYGLTAVSETPLSRPEKPFPSAGRNILMDSYRSALLWTNP